MSSALPQTAPAGAPAMPVLTACGRLPGVPLKNKRHEHVAQWRAAGKSAAESCRLAEALDPAGSSFESNARKLCQRPEIREREAEIALAEAETAGIYAGWVLEDVKLFARASLSRFWKRDDSGKLDLQDGKPVMDFSHATEDDIRTLGEVSFNKYGPVIKLRDMPGALEKLGRYLDLWSGDGEANVSVAATAVVRVPALASNADEWKAQHAPSGA